MTDADLLGRLEAHARLHDGYCEHVPQDAEQAQWAADLRAAARLIETLKVGHDRYETVRRMNVQQFQDAFVLNRRTGKPFDEIVDDLKPFLRLNVAVKPRRQASA